MPAAQITFSETELADIRHQAVAELRAELAAERGRALEDLLSFSVEEIAIAKGICVESAKGLLTKHRVSAEKLGYRTKRYPLRELRLIFDELTIKGLRALREKARAA